MARALRASLTLLAGPIRIRISIYYHMIYNCLRADAPFHIEGFLISLRVETVQDVKRVLAVVLVGVDVAGAVVSAVLSDDARVAGSCVVLEQTLGFAILAACVTVASFAVERVLARSPVFGTLRGRARFGDRSGSD